MQGTSWEPATTSSFWQLPPALRPVNGRPGVDDLTARCYKETFQDRGCSEVLPRSGISPGLRLHPGPWHPGPWCVVCCVGPSCQRGGSSYYREPVILTIPGLAVTSQKRDLECQQPQVPSEGLGNPLLNNSSLQALPVCKLLEAKVCSVVGENSS